MVDLVIKNGKIVSSQGVILGGVAVDNGKIVQVGSDSSLPSGGNVIDAGGKIIFPGAIDPHTHLGNRGLAKFGGDVTTESADAVTGGVTTICTTTHLEKRPIRVLFEEALEACGKNCYADFKPYPCPFTRTDLEQIPDVVKRGASGFKFFGLSYRGPAAELFGMPPEGTQEGYLWEAFEKIAQSGHPAFAMVHPEVPDIYEVLMPRVRTRNVENLVAAWYECRPNICETIHVFDVALIAHEVECPMYIPHTSAKETVDLILDLKRRGFDVFGETCIHYLVHTIETAKQLEARAKVNPPIRTAADRARLWLGLSEGAMESVGTDHTTHHSLKDKDEPDFWDARVGVGPGMGLLLPIMFSEGVGKGRITLERLAKVVAENTARRWGLYPRKGAIQPGADADMVIIDPRLEVTVRIEDLKTAGEYTIYEGMRIKGFPVQTYLRGQLVAESRELVARNPTGTFVA